MQRETETETETVTIGCFPRCLYHVNTLDISAGMENVFCCFGRELFVALLVTIDIKIANALQKWLAGEQLAALPGGASYNCVGIEKKEHGELARENSSPHCPD